MTIQSISEILTRVAGGDKVNGKARLLQKYDNATLRKILKYTFSPKVTFDLLPKGEPPYKPNDLVDQEGVLYHETRRLYLFTDGGNPDLKQLRKEALFIEVLEAVAPADAKLLIGMKDKKLPEEYKGITKAVVEKAFPGLL
jgi:hypothetical protein